MKRTTIQGAGDAPNKPGDILYINDDRMIVTKVGRDVRSYTMYLEPLETFISGNKLLSIPGFEGTLLGYIQMLCNEYEDGCCC
jgi:hypothetical protein